MRFLKLLGNMRCVAIKRSFTSKTQTLFVDADNTIDIKNPYERTKKVCILCKYKVLANYKNVKLLSQFQSPYTGRIYGRHITGLCKTQQEIVEKAIIRAQNCALMPAYNKDIDFISDPRLFDADRPIRPHKY